MPRPEVLERIKAAEEEAEEIVAEAEQDRDDRIAEALELSAGGVGGIRRRFSERGLEGCVHRKSPDREYDRKLDGEQEAALAVSELGLLLLVAGLALLVPLWQHWQTTAGTTVPVGILFQLGLGAILVRIERV